MKAKTIRKVLKTKIAAWVASIEDEAVRALAEKNTIVTGGCIASMLKQESVNDYDVYFRNIETTEAVAKYYVAKFLAVNANHPLAVTSENGRVRITTPNGYRGETAGALDAAETEDTYTETEEKALAVDDGTPKYRPVFMSTNAITLSHKVQVVLRFYGEPEEIHKNYDFVHCTNYWTSWEDKLQLNQAALESLLSKELRYVGSLYPVCSIMRLRKFIARGWQINAGQILKMVMQVSQLDLLDPKVLEDQLTGVDSAYFCQLIEKLAEKDPDKVNAAYLVEIIDRIF